MTTLNTKIKSKIKNKNAGFTLIEVVMAIAIATIVFIGTFNSIASMTTVNREANLKREIQNQITNMAESIYDASPITKAQVIPTINAYRISVGEPTFPNYAAGVTRYERKISTVKQKQTQVDTYLVIDISHDNIVRIRAEKRIDYLLANGTPQGTPYILPSINEMFVWRED